MKPKVIVIVGPTASGKTKVSIEVAKRIDGEIVSSDSMQIYREMTIGTAKPTMEERQGIPHFMIDVVKPDEMFNVSKYKKMAEEAIETILAKGKTPILVGGTGLYISTLVNGIEFTQVESDAKYREELLEIAQKQGYEVLFERLKEVDPEAAEVIEKNNIRRVIRALEIYHITGKTKTQLDRESRKEVKYEYLLFGMELPREMLYERINLRVDQMLEAGLVEEVKALIQKYTVSSTAMQGLGYKEVIEYLEGKLTYEEMVEKLKLETRHYAKRQLTWFRKEERILWVSPEEAVEKIVAGFVSGN